MTLPRSLLLALAAWLPLPAAAAPAESPEMTAWMKAATPGEPHAALARLAGKYDVESRFYAGAGTEPQVSKGQAEQTMIMGGRYLRQDYTGEMAGQGFQGLGILGYDNVRKRFFSYWIDGMSTMPLTHEGTCKNKECSLIELRGEYTDPLSGKKKKSRTTLEVGAEGRLTFTMYDQDKKGREFRTLELIYTRR